MMAVTQEEKDLLQSGKDLESLASHPGWQRILSVLQKWELAACEDVLAGVDLPDPEISKRVARWQERQSLRQALLESVHQAIKTKRDWIESLRHDPQARFIMEELHDDPGPTLP